MNEATQQLKEIDLEINEANKRIANMDALIRLTNNKDYIRIIDEGYLREEAIRLTHLRADYNFRSDEDQRSLLLALDAIAQFKQYAASTIQMGRAAKNAIEADEQTRDELFDEAV